MSELRRRILLFVLLGVTMMLLSTGVAMAASTLDQQNTVYTDPNNPDGGFSVVAANLREWQTFTAGMSGHLDQVSLYGALIPVSRDPLHRAPGDLTVDILAVDPSGYPTGSSLGYGSVPATSFTPNAYKWFDATLSQPALLSSGTQYALVVGSTEEYDCTGGPTHPDCTGFYDIGVAPSGNPYPGGHSGRFTIAGDPVPYKDRDLAFKTYVSPAPPEVPTTKKQCKNGGWKRFKDESGQPLFKNQGQCIKYVNQANK